MATDPLDELSIPSLKDQLEPYEYVGNAELELALLAFAKKFGDPGIATPAAALADYRCPECRQTVRGVSRGTDSVLLCPICGHQPGALTLGREVKE